MFVVRKIRFCNKSRSGGIFDTPGGYEMPQLLSKYLPSFIHRWLFHKKEYIHMLTGCHAISIHASDCLIIPDELRKSLSGRFFITQGFEQNLILFSGELFEQFSKQFLQLSLTDPLARLLSRMIFSNAAELEIGSSGELHIPEHLRACTKIQDMAVLVGQGVYCEIWSQELWKIQELNLRDAEANSSRFNGYQLCIA
jgi:MraZ protein